MREIFPYRDQKVFRQGMETMEAYLSAAASWVRFQNSSIESILFLKDATTSEHKIEKERYQEYNNTFNYGIPDCLKDPTKFAQILLK